MATFSNPAIKKVANSDSGPSTQMGADWETTEILICGCGPTGAMLSGYLGKAGISNVVIDREAEITTDPRGIALDEDGIRLVQGLGLYKHVFTDIGTAIPRLRFVGGVHHDLHKAPFMCIDCSSTEGHTGHVGAMSHKQPELERHLRSQITAHSCCNLRSGCTLTSIWEDINWVYATYMDRSGTERKVRSRFLVGADGKTGYTRKNYLEKRGIQLLWAGKTKYQETWVALNWKMTLPTPETHPSFPLWKLGYTPEQVYDAFFPAEFRFLCNPQRPAVCGRFGLPSDRLWRFEFVVADDERDDEMATPANIEKVVVPYITHPGLRYGLSENVTYPADCIDVLRCRPFRFSARSCDKWALGRVILCGDAAHVFPPFGGQGIASGFRDAIALSWRLTIACRSTSMEFEHALGAWYSERKQQLEASLASTIRNGDMVNSKNTTRIFFRDWALWLLQLIPPVKRWIELGPRMNGRMVYQYEAGMAFMPRLGGGVLFSQTYCVGLESTAGHLQVRFTDDVIFVSQKRESFQIVVLLDGDLGQLDSLRNDLDGLERSCSRLCPAEATFFVRRSLVPTELPIGTNKLRGVFRTATAAEFDSSPLCDGRPKARGYREYDMWDGVGGKKYAILRADRFVFAACSTRCELEDAARRLQELFPQ